MDLQDVIRGWKDEEFRMSLGSDKQGLLPENPAGSIELGREQLGQDDSYWLSDGSPLCIPPPTITLTIPHGIGVMPA